jgi:uncharacterized membrane protein
LLFALASVPLTACGERRAEPAANGAGNAAAEAPAPAPAPGHDASTVAAPTPAPPAAEPARPASSWSRSGYRLIGTEPFWGGTVSATRIVYQTPDNQSGESIAVTASYSPAREVYAGRSGGKPFVLTLTRGPCSDGMSDNVHAFTAALQVQGETRQGCANPQ